MKKSKFMQEVQDYFYRALEHAAEENDPKLVLEDQTTLKDGSVQLLLGFEEFALVEPKVLGYVNVTISQLKK